MRSLRTAALAADGRALAADGCPLAPLLSRVRQLELCKAELIKQVAFARDCITVWLRTRVCPIVFERDGSGDDDDSDDGPQGWADVPAAEQLDPDCAAPCARLGLRPAADSKLLRLRDSTTP